MDGAAKNHAADARPVMGVDRPTRTMHAGLCSHSWRRRRHIQRCYGRTHWSSRVRHRVRRRRNRRRRRTLCGVGGFCRDRCQRTVRERVLDFDVAKGYYVQKSDWIGSQIMWEGRVEGMRVCDVVREREMKKVVAAFASDALAQNFCCAKDAFATSGLGWDPYRHLQLRHSYERRPISKCYVLSPTCCCSIPSPNVDVMVPVVFICSSIHSSSPHSNPYPRSPFPSAAN